MKKHETPMLDQLEQGPWPSFISGIKRLRDEHHDERVNGVANDLLGQLEHSYETRRGYWKGRDGQRVRLRGRDHPPLLRGRSAVPEVARVPYPAVQPPAGNYYTTDMLRKLADSWEKWGSGLVTFHGQTGNIMFIGANTENTQHFFDDINDYGFDLGGAGPCVRTAQSCVGSARCEQSCANEHKIHRSLVNNFVDDIHRPALPYKFKFKVSGCPNDCMNSIERADFAVIGTWRDEMKVDQDEVRAYVGRKGRKYLIDNVITRCPTNALSLNDDDTIEVDDRNLRAVHALPERDAEVFVAWRREGGIGPHRRQAHAQDRRPVRHRGGAVHEARYPGGLRPPGGDRGGDHRLLRRERAGARTGRGDDRAHRTRQLPGRDRPRSGPQHDRPTRGRAPTCGPIPGTKKPRNGSSAGSRRSAARARRHEAGAARTARTPPRPSFPGKRQSSDHAGHIDSRTSSPGAPVRGPSEVGRGDGSHGECRRNQGARKRRGVSAAVDGGTREPDEDARRWQRSIECRSSPDARTDSSTCTRR